MKVEDPQGIIWEVGKVYAIFKNSKGEMVKEVKIDEAPEGWEIVEGDAPEEGQKDVGKLAEKPLDNGQEKE